VRGCPEWALGGLTSGNSTRRSTTEPEQTRALQPAALLFRGTSQCAVLHSLSPGQNGPPRGQRCGAHDGSNGRCQLRRAKWNHSATFDGSMSCRRQQRTGTTCRQRSLWLSRLARAPDWHQRAAQAYRVSSSYKSAGYHPASRHGACLARTARCATRWQGVWRGGRHFPWQWRFSGNATDGVGAGGRWPRDRGPCASEPAAMRL